MESLIVITVVVIAVALAFDALRKGKRRAPVEESEAHTLTADETDTTQTGKYRVEQMLKMTKKPGSKSSAQELLPESPEEGSLPDPFGTGSHKIRRDR